MNSLTPLILEEVLPEPKQKINFVRWFFESSRQFVDDTKIDIRIQKIAQKTGLSIEALKPMKNRKMHHTYSRRPSSWIELSLVEKIHNAYPDALEIYLRHYSSPSQSDGTVETRDRFAVHILEILQDADLVEDGVLDARQCDLLIYFGKFPNVLREYVILVKSGQRQKALHLINAALDDMNMQRNRLF